MIRIGTATPERDNRFWMTGLNYDITSVDPGPYPLR
jgi:hypothetical protein